MSGFLYFKPQQTKNVSPEDVKAWGLSYAFEKLPTSRGCHNNTPTGTAGMVFAEESRHEAGCVKMDMDAQVWRKMPRPGQDDIYVGYWKESPPGPDDLQRSKQLGGYRLQLRDGEQWLCPLVRMFDTATETLANALPAAFDLDENGEPKAGDTVAEYAYLYDLMSDYAAHMQAGTLEERFAALSMGDLCRDAAKLLQANYLVDLPEIRVLDLWQVRGDECREASTLVLSAIDYGTYSTWEISAKKKTDPPAAVAG